MALPPKYWIRATALAGVTYAIVGIVFAIPTTHAKAWRLAAWIVSGVVYGAHILHARLRLRAGIDVAAFQVALGAAIGAFGLALGANVHAIATGALEHQRALLLSLILWPAIVMIPAFLVAVPACALVRIPNNQTAIRGTR